MVASGDPQGDQALPIRADAKVLAATIPAGDSITLSPASGRHQYLVAASGAIRINGQLASARDGVAIRDEAIIVVEALDHAEVVLVDSL